MATIPVEKKSSTPLWLWLLIPLLLLLLLWFFLGRRDDRDADTAAVDETSQTPGDGTTGGAGTAAGTGTDGGIDTDAAAGAAAGAAGAAAGAAVTNVDELYGENLASLVGRRVEIDDATVLSVTGDSTFYVGADGRRFLVALSGLGESATGPGDNGEDGRLDIDTGDRVTIRGTVERFDAANRVFGRLSEADRTEGTTRGAFVNVTRVADVARR